jgi:multimeric flavodoxin WrbA
MHVLGLMGSPRLGGNTELLLDEVLRGAQSKGADTEKLIISSYKIKPCFEIYGCRKTGRCVIKDDFDKVLDSVFNADALILASPIFFYSLPAHTKAFVDRCQSLWVNKYILKRPLPIQKERKGYFVSVGATKGEKLFKGVKLTVKYFFDALDINYAGQLLIRGVDEKGAIKLHPTALQDAYYLGENIHQDFN